MAQLYKSVLNPLVTPKLHREVRSFARQVNKNLFRADLHDFVGKLTGFDFVYTEDNCGGYCDVYGRIIALHRDAANVKHTICHELAHFIQINNGIGQLPFATLSEQVSFEQQCETMAYHLHKEWYKNTDHRIFTSYFARENHRFLMQWYGEQLQDDLKLSEDKPILWLK